MLFRAVAAPKGPEAPGALPLEAGSWSRAPAQHRREEKVHPFGGPEPKWADDTPEREAILLSDPGQR